MNWRAFQASPRAHPATRFVHRPHFSLENEKGCTSCHVLATPPDEDTSYDGYDPDLAFAGSFEPIARETCAGCHMGEAASDSCVTCHDYHLSNFAPLYLQAGGPAR